MAMQREAKNRLEAWGSAMRPTCSMDFMMGKLKAQQAQVNTSTRLARVETVMQGRPEDVGGRIRSRGGLLNRGGGESGALSPRGGFHAEGREGDVGVVWVRAYSYSVLVTYC